MNGYGYGSARLGETQACAVRAEIGGGFNPTPVPRDKGVVSVALDRIAGGLDDLQASVAALREKLEPVMRPSEPRPVGENCATDKPVCSPTVHYAMSLRQRIEGLVYQINELTSRAES